MKIKFTQDCSVPNMGEHYAAGEIYELETSKARRWLRRNLATEVQGAVKPAPKKSKAKVAPKLVRKPPITSAKTASKPDDSNTGGRPVPVTSDGGSSSASGNDSDK